MTRKIQLILNPMADMGNAWRVANDLRPIINEQSDHVRWSGTVYPSHATELARQAGMEGYDMVVALGGDGTCHEVVNGLMQVPANQRPAMGIVPIGSGNDLAYTLGIPNSPAHALAFALQNEPQPIDIGQITDERGRQEYFDNTLGIGFDAVVTIRSHRLPLLRGFAMYLVAVLQTILLNHHPAQLKIETESDSWQQEALMVAVCNGPREGGGFLLGPGANPRDGLLRYSTVKNCSRLTMLQLLPEVMKGTHTKHPIVKMGDCRKMSIQSDIPLYIHLDGEVYTSFGSNLRQVHIELLPGALRIACRPE